MHLVETIRVERLVWTAQNVRYVRRHRGSIGAVEAVLAKAPRYFLNKAGRTATHVMIGPDSRGRMWTIPILEKEPLAWMPVNCWPSTRTEIRLYQSLEADNDETR